MYVFQTITERLTQKDNPTFSQNAVNGAWFQKQPQNVQIHTAL